MLILILLLCSLGVLAAAAAFFRGREQKPPEAPGETPAAARRPEGCCGQHDVCERDHLMAAVGRKADYYDDEELDRYAGTAPDAYPDEAVDEFREVLYTMRETEVAGWLRSLQLRNLSLPAVLKDEALLIVGEQRRQA